MHPARVRTFKPRRRPLTATRAARFAELAPRWCLAESGSPIDPAEVFGRVAPLVLEIGIGAGDALVPMAIADPTTDVIGADVHTPGVAAALAWVDEAGITNVRLVHGDALVFAHRLPPASLAGIRAYFPDPWPKARHRHRRLVAERHLVGLVDLLAPGGSLHLATDIDDYARHAGQVCGALAELDGGVVPRPADRPVTRYERKGLAAGREVVDLVYRRR